MTTEGAYRCAECKNWRHLMAWAAGLIEGPLDASGNLTRYDYVDECYLHEDSIHCTKHIDAPIEMFRKGRWCRWWSCPKCQGHRRIGTDRRYPCLGGIKVPDSCWYDGMIHEGWLPPEQVPAALGLASGAVP